MYVILTALCVALVVGHLIQDHRSALRRQGVRLSRPPGTLPFAGYGPWFLRPRHRLLAWLAAIQPSMGFETYELPVPSLPPAVLVNDPAILEQVLRDTRTFVKGAFFRERSEDLFRDGILNADGELWRVQRKAGLRWLSKGNVQDFVDAVLPALIADMVGRLEAAAAAAATGDGEDGRVVDLQEELLELTTRFMGRIAYDMELSGDMPFSRAFDYASKATGWRFTNPAWKLKEYFFGRSLREAIAKVHGFGAAIVGAAREVDEPKEPDKLKVDSRGIDALQINLIDSLIKHIPSTKTVAAAAMNFLSAGRDTTAQSMAWTMYCLLRNPQKLERLRKSLSSRTNHDRDPVGVQLGYADLANPCDQTYLSAVFAEALRLCPLIPLEIKETTVEVMLKDGTALPKGAVVIWTPYAMARNPLIWGKDAPRFRPERWIDGLQEKVAFKFDNGEESKAVELDFSRAHFLPNMKSAFENPVFNGGPRMCIGKRLAEMLAGVVVARLVTEFDFVEVRGVGEIDEERVGQDSLTMPIQGGLPVRVSKRRKEG